VQDGGLGHAELLSEEKITIATGMSSRVYSRLNIRSFVRYLFVNPDVARRLLSPLEPP